ncbi:MAG: radical SAM protein [Bacteriovorax sp.]|nr:radical SAM protein [Bacteriovorax sp.]
MDKMILKPTLKSLIFNTPSLEVWTNLFRYGVSRFRPSVQVSHTPISMVIYVSKRCNFKCSFCFTYSDLNKADWQDYELSPDGFEQLMNSEFGRKVLRVGFLGGEPFMNPYLFDFLESAHRKGKITTIVTNASLVDEEKKQKLKKISPTMLGISLYDNNLNDVAQLSEWMASQSKDFWVQSVVESTGLEKIKEKILFANKHGVKNLILSNYHPSYSHEKEKVIFADNNEFKKISKEARTLASQLGMQLTLPNPIQREYKIRSCTMAFNYVHVDAKGVLGPCCFRAPKEEYGSIYESNSWNNEPHLKLRETFLNSKLEPLSECAYCENFSRDLYSL